MKYWLTFLGIIFIIIFSFAEYQAEETRDFDLLIQNGKIVDGTRNPWYRADIGIRGDTIVEIGDLSTHTASLTIDARGLIVSPGFIDMHTHCDNWFYSYGLGDPETQANLNYLTQGVTTVVTGNCGGGTFKIAETETKWEKQGIGTNAVLLVGFGTLREEVLGVEEREPTTEELENMKSLLRQAMIEGAWGMSTGLQYIPDRFASTEEIIELAKLVAEYGGIYSSHQRSEEKYMVEATEETIRIAKESDVRANVAHMKAGGKSNWGKMKEAGKLINQARNQGIYITADMYPYKYASVGPIFQCFNIPKELNIPNVDELRQSGEDPKLFTEELAQALSDPEKRAMIKKLTAEGAPDQNNFAVQYGWDSFSVVFAKKNTHLIDKIISDIAEEQNKDPFDVAADLFIEEKGDVFSSVDTMSEADMEYAVKQDWLMFSSDGSALPIKKITDKPVPGHPRSFGSFPRALGKYVREEKILPLADAVRKMSSLPASLLQMKDRGLLLKGYKADIAIFDPQAVTDNATYTDSQRYSSGIEYVIINGKLSIENGEYNSALNGRVLLLTENK